MTWKQLISNLVQINNNKGKLYQIDFHSKQTDILPLLLIGIFTSAHISKIYHPQDMGPKCYSRVWEPSFPKQMLVPQASPVLA